MSSSATHSLPLIALRRVGKAYGSHDNRVDALLDIDLDIAQGEFVAIMGASGSGKSTCLNVLGFLDRPSCGQYSFEGQPTSGLSQDDLALLRRTRLGFVFQSFYLLPRATALENVELPLRYRRIPKEARRKLAQEALARVGLTARAHHLPRQLSGGQQQRVAIARALVGRPSVVLADEPTGNLDSERSREIIGLLSSIAAQGVTVVMVTHEPEMAAYASRTVVFRDGRIVSDRPDGRRESRLPCQTLMGWG